MIVLINLKAYDVDPLVIARASRRVDADDVRIAIAPQPTAISTVAGEAPETWAQHVDPIDHGSHTGHVHASAVARAGANGTIINHSERRLTLDAITRSIRSAGQAGLETIVCANSPEQIAAVAALDPDMVAVEPPALIGTGTPVSTADPDIVRNAVEAAARVDPDIPVLCGAGIGSGEDVRAASELGADGVLLASGVAKADDPGAVLADLVSGA